MPAVLACGETYRIAPIIWQEVVRPISSPGSEGSDGYVERVDYEILRSPALFTRDPAKGYFNAVVRNFTVSASDTFRLKFAGYSEYLQANSYGRADYALLTPSFWLERQHFSQMTRYSRNNLAGA